MQILDSESLLKNRNYNAEIIFNGKTHQLSSGGHVDDTKTKQDSNPDTIKNLKINKSVIKKSRKFKLIRTIVVLTIIIPALIFGTIQAHNAIEQNQKDKIVNYYGDNSYEDRLLEYIDLSETLDGLDLNEYQVNDDLYEKYNIFSELMSPQEIKKLIEKADEMNAFTRSKDLEKQHENINIILNLKKQEKLVNNYISYEGFKLAHENVTDASKKYAAEVFGIDAEDITFKIIPGTSTTPDSVVITNTTTDENGIVQNNNYVIDEVAFGKSLSEIKQGVYEMSATSDNKYSTSSYDDDRNKDILSALKQSIDMNKERLEKDLYSERLAAKIR